MNNLAMEKTYESRRLQLKALVQKLGRGGIASIAKRIEVEPNYLSRCLYPPGKKGRKNIGDEVATSLDEKVPEWNATNPNLFSSSRNQRQLAQTTLNDPIYQTERSRLAMCSIN